MGFQNKYYSGLRAMWRAKCQAYRRTHNISVNLGEWLVTIPIVIVHASRWNKELGYTLTLAQSL